MKAGDRAAWSGLQGAYTWDTERLPPTGDADSTGSERSTSCGCDALQGMTAQYLLYDARPLKQGQTALIHAAAGVCLLLVQMAHNIGARVIATVPPRKRRSWRKTRVRTKTILYMQAHPEADTTPPLAGKGVDVVYDSVGKTTFEKGLNVLRRAE